MSKFALLFLLLFFGGLVAVVAYNGAAAFFIYQIVYMMNPEDRWWGADIPSLRYSFITAVVMLAALLFRYGEYSRQSPWLAQPTFRWLLLFLVLHYVAYFYALDFPVHTRFTEYFLKLVIVILVAYKLINTEKLLDQAIWVYLAGAAYVGYYGRAWGRSNSGRLEGVGMVDTSGDANLAASAIVPSVVILMFYAWHGSLKVKAVCAVFGAFIVNVLILMNSRGAFLGVVVGAGTYVLFMLFSKHQRGRQRLFALVVVAAGLSGSLYLTDATFWTRMETLERNEEGERGSDGRGRIHFWLTTLDMVKDYPLGMGIGGYTQVSAIYLDPNKTNYATERRVPHSTWFQILGDFGYAGLFVFLMMLASVFLTSRRTKKELLQRGEIPRYQKVVALECALLSFFATATFIDRGRAEILYWMILFILCASNVYRQDEQRER